MNAILFFAGVPIRAGYGITGGGWLLTHEKLGSETDHQVILNAKALDFLISSEADLINPAVTYPVSTVNTLKTKITRVQWPYGVVHMGAGNPLKEWPSENFIALMDRMLRSGLAKSFFLIGTEEERLKAPLSSRSEVIDLRGLTHLHELACLLDGAAFFVGNDSGPAHLAAAQGIPVILIPSATNDIRVWHPWTKKLCVVSHSDGELVTIDQVQAAILSIMSQG